MVLEIMTHVAMSIFSAQVSHCYSPVKGTRCPWINHVTPGLSQQKHKASLEDVMLEGECSGTNNKSRKGHKSQLEGLVPAKFGIWDNLTIKKNNCERQEIEF